MAGPRMTEEEFERLMQQGAAASPDIVRNGQTWSVVPNTQPNVWDVYGGSGYIPNPEGQKTPEQVAAEIMQSYGLQVPTMSENGLIYAPKTDLTKIGDMAGPRGLAELFGHGLSYPLAAFGAGQAGSFLANGGLSGFSNPFSSISNFFGGEGVTPATGTFGNAPGIGGSIMNVGAEGASGIGELADYAGDNLFDFDMANMGEGLTGPSGYGTAAGSSFSLKPEQVVSMLGSAGAGGGSGGLMDSLKSAFPQANLGSLLQGALQGGLGYLGAKQQSDALKEMQDKYLGLGAPYRDMLQQTYQPGYSVFNDSATRDAATQAADFAARSYSAQGGNPFDNPTGQSNIYESVLGRVALPQLNTTRSQLGSFGQLGTNIAGTAGLQGAQQAGGGLDAIGYGLGTALNPQTDLETLLKKLGQQSQQQSQAKLTY